MSELTVEMWRDDMTEKLRNLWPWKPVSQVIERKGDEFLFYAPCDDFEIDYALQRAAAIEYLDRRKEAEPEPKTASLNNVLVPIAMMLALIAIIGLTAGWAFR